MRLIIIYLLTRIFSCWIAEIKWNKSWNTLEISLTLKEIIVLEPAAEGTQAIVASSIENAKSMLDSGMTPASAILPRIKPKNINQLTMEF